MDTDPLVLFLKKEAAHTHSIPPMTVMLDSEGMLDSNILDMLFGRSSHRLMTPPANHHLGQGLSLPTADVKHGDKRTKEVMKDNFPDFVGTKAIRDKYDEKDHEFDEGVVDRVLGL